MELVNQTAVPAMAVVTTGGPDGSRLGLLVAKATFQLNPGGAALDRNDPLPLFEEDEPTDVGLLPRDVHARPGATFEVFLVGSAHAPGGQPVPSLTVALSVGGHRATMAVFGDRMWTSDHRITEPEPFIRMPLVWDRAFGGSCDVWLDEATVIQVRDPWNCRGRGFDGEAAGERMAVAMGAADDYPRVAYDRLLPNLELPHALIRSPDDVPDPVCWSAGPADVGFPHIDLYREVKNADDPADASHDEKKLTLRAYPDWQIPLPEAGVDVVLDGCVPEGRLAFRLPRLRVLADYVHGDRHGCRELEPHALVLLPDQRRACLLYRSHFTAHIEEGLERSFRLRLEEGWYDAASGRESGSN